MKEQFAVRSAVALPPSCPAEFRKKILEIRSGKVKPRKPVAVPVVATQSADAIREDKERNELQGKLASAILTLL
jgi:hypothetical protein